jgi:hypothetical protein
MAVGQLRSRKSFRHNAVDRGHSITQELDQWWAEVSPGALRDPRSLLEDAIEREDLLVGRSFRNANQSLLVGGRINLSSKLAIRTNRTL